MYSKSDKSFACFQALALPVDQINKVNKVTFGYHVLLIDGALAVGVAQIHVFFGFGPNSTISLTSALYNFSIFLPFLPFSSALILIY
jgi:hypothetical protein